MQLAPLLRGPACLTTLLLVGGACTTPQVPIGPPPPAPIPLEQEATPSILYEKTIFRIPPGARIGGNFDQTRGNRELGPKIFDRAITTTESYNILATDRLREVGYDAVDGTSAVFSEESIAKTRFRLVGLVTKLQLDDYFNRYRREQNYQNAFVDMELELYDNARKEVVYERAFSGSARDVGMRPQAFGGAMIAALDGALADPDFVDRIVHADDAAGEPQVALKLPRCKPAGLLRMPRDSEEVASSVVVVRLGTALGSGVVVSPRGHVLTAAHVVEAGAVPTVTLPSGLEFDAEILRFDPQTDLALLSLPGSRHPCAAVETGPAPVGSDVFAIGSPLSPELSRTVTRGIVSGQPVIDGQRFIQTDAAVAPGSSGGPLVDADGRVLGIVSSKAIGTGVEGIAFGIPIGVVVERLAIEWSD